MKATLHPQRFAHAALFFLLAACGGPVLEPEDEQDPDSVELRGTYEGEFHIHYHASLGRIDCGGPGTVHITSTRDGAIGGDWEFGPNTFPDQSLSYWWVCGEDDLDWHRSGTLGGSVERDDSLTLTLHEPPEGGFPGTRFFGYEWGAVVRADTLRIGGLHMVSINSSWSLSFEGLRQ